MSLDMGVGGNRDRLIEAIVHEVEQQRRAGALIKVYRFGFLRLPFTESRNETGNGLHLWLPEDLPADEAPHIHNSTLASRVLVGNLTNIEWNDPVPDPDGDHMRVMTRCTDTVCQDISSEPVSIEETGRQTIGQDGVSDYYEVPQGQFHSTEFTEPTLTIIRKTDFVRDIEMLVPNILPRGTKLKATPFDITNFDQNRAWELLDSALAQL